MNRLRGLSGRPSYLFFEKKPQHQLEMVRPSSLGVIDVPPVPAGYLLRQLSSGDEGPYDDLFHLAFADEGRFAKTIDGHWMEAFL
jgi:hypothetical protein